jgi:hypothetical protein
MKSRYDFMQDSVVIDEDGACFPDPLLDYNNGKLSRIPTLYTITDQDLRRFWTCMWEQYQQNENDDLWLMINGIDYVMSLKPGDQIYKVASEDLEGYITTRVLGTE